MTELEAQEQAIDDFGILLDKVQFGTELADLANAHPLAIVLFRGESPNMVISFANTAFLKATGWTVRNLANVPWLTLTHPDDVAASVRESNEICSDGNPRPAIRFHNRYRCAPDFPLGTWIKLRWWASSGDHGQAIFGVSEVLGYEP